MNPYDEVAGVQHQEMFFNRQAEIEILSETLGGDAQHCISLVGQRKIGKTSVITEFARRWRTDGLPNGVLVYLDCQRHVEDCRSPMGFFSAVLRALEAADPALFLKVSGVVDSNSGDLGLGHVLERFDQAGIVVVVALDEFDKAVASESLINGGVFGSLRSFGQHIRRFAWVTSTHQYLHQLFEESFELNGIVPSRRRSESDFFNIAPAQIVGLFGGEDATALAVEPANVAGRPFTSDEVAAILHFGGRFPYFVQRMAFHVFGSRLSVSLTQSALLERSVREATPIWDGFLGRLTESELEVLHCVANGMAVTPCAELESLKEASLIYVDDAAQALKTFSGRFGEFVLSRGRSKRPGKAALNRGLPEIPTGLFPLEILNETREYIVRIGLQVQGCYQGGYYDACAVMIRRLLETLIIECFEEHGIGGAVKATDGEYYFLRDLISEFVIRTEWAVSRNSRAALLQLKAIGDLSAHSRRFTARKEDINRVSNDLRVSLEELVHIAGFDRSKKQGSSEVL